MLTRELAKIEANAKKKIAEIRGAAELEAFNLLTPEQRDKALGLVAGTYELPDATDEQRAILKFVNEHEGNIPRSK